MSQQLEPYGFSWVLTQNPGANGTQFQHRAVGLSGRLNKQSASLYQVVALSNGLQKVAKEHQSLLHCPMFRFRANADEVGRIYRLADELWQGPYETMNYGYSVLSGVMLRDTTSSIEHPQGQNKSHTLAVIMPRDSILTSCVRLRILDNVTETLGEDRVILDDGPEGYDPRFILWAQPQDGSRRGLKVPLSQMIKRDKKVLLRPVIGEVGPLGQLRSIYTPS
ncbi:MAG: hypothetical protein IPI58_05490 [Alphaproteobacteria bacterium]|nr:MAG: hypothetical protein IPI58_05490 [Alphaproteobacteria bacterium]